MSIKLQFLQDGKTIEYTLEDVTIEVQAPPPFGNNSASITLENVSLTVAGKAPWDGIELECAIPSLNVRDSKATKGDPIAELLQGDKVTVSAKSTVIGDLTWRQIYKPDKLYGKWTAEKYKDNVYLAPVGTVQSQTNSGEQTNSGAAAIDRETESPAPLTGRFDLVQRNGPHGTYTALSIDGDSSPKMGVNIRELAYFGTPQWQYTSEKWLNNYASEIAAMGMKWVRFFAANRNYTNEKIVRRIQTVLDIFAKHNLITVFCFADSLSEKGLFPAGDEPYHSASRGHYDKSYFNNKNYTENYLPFVKLMVETFKDHKAVGMWQLMNEMAIYNPPASDKDLEGFARFVDEVSEAIYTIDSTHPISIGIINTAHIMPPGKDLNQFARDFYSQRKFIHVATSHCYQFRDNTNPHAVWEHEDFCALDADVANESGRAMFWTEFSAADDGDRRASSERFLDRHLVQGPASGALQWAFMLELDGIQDSGVGGYYGFAPRFNKQYEQLKDLFVNKPKNA